MCSLYIKSDEVDKLLKEIAFIFIFVFVFSLMNEYGVAVPSEAV